MNYINTVREAIIQLAEHDQRCGVFDLDDEGKHCECTCGLNKALTALDALEQAMREPVMWQRRMRPTWGHGNAPWGPWVECSEGSAKDCWKTPLLHDWAYEARALYTAAPVAQQHRTRPEQGQFCFCGDEISLQMVSGGAAPEGLYGRVTLKVRGEYVNYVRTEDKHPAAKSVRVLEFVAQHKSSDWPERCQRMVDMAREVLAAPVAQQHVPEADCGNIDWKAQYEHQKRRAERWIAKYEADIGPLETAGPVAQQPQACVIRDAYCESAEHKCDDCPVRKQPQAEAEPITSETGNQAAQGASAITSESVPEHPYLTPKGIAEQWTEKTVPLLTEAEIRNALQSTNHMVRNAIYGAFWPELEEACRAIESMVRSKLGAGVPMTREDRYDAFTAAERAAGENISPWSFDQGVRAAERHHGIVGKEGGNANQA